MFLFSAFTYLYDPVSYTHLMLYDTDINYYFRLNFAGFVQIIDALGGITVDSDYDFTTQNSSGYHFTKGPNQVNGEQAIAFCRERYAFSAGDRQRGKDQMKVIQGVINKATSPDILKNYLSLLDSLSGCFETNIPYDVITSLAVSYTHLTYNCKNDHCSFSCNISSDRMGRRSQSLHFSDSVCGRKR